MDKIQTRELCTMIENLTPTIQSSQEKKFEVLNSPSLALKKTAIPLLPSALPSSQIYQLPNFSDPTLL